MTNYASTDSDYVAIKAIITGPVPLFSFEQVLSEAEYALAQEKWLCMVELMRWADDGDACPTMPDKE